MPKSPLPEKDPTSIGNILVNMSLLTEKELEELVDKFKASKEELLGEFIVRHTKITEEHVELAMMKQRALRNGRTTHEAVIHAYDISAKTNKRVISVTDEIISLTSDLVLEET